MQNKRVQTSRINRFSAIIAALMALFASALIGTLTTGTAQAASRTFTGFGLTADGHGYLLTSSAGEFYAFGTASPQPNPTGFTGSIVGVATTANGRGTLAVSSAGQLYAYGTAHPWPNPTGFTGSIVGVAMTADGQGALAVSSAGQLYAYGTAHPWPNPTGFTSRITSVALTADGQGAVAMSDTGQFYAYGAARPQSNPTGFTGPMIGLKLTADGQGLTALSSSGQIYAYGTAQWLGNGDPGSSETAQDLARQIITNNRVAKTGRLVAQDLQDAAAGRSAYTRTDGSKYQPLSATILRLVTTLAQNHTVTINALESGGTGHVPGSAHYSGRAIDFGPLDGQAVKSVTGRDDNAVKEINETKGLLPSGSKYGQLNCGPRATPQLPPGVSEIGDTCNHLHVQIP
jgi:hypothetical protein